MHKQWTGMDEWEVKMHELFMTKLCIAIDSILAGPLLAYLERANARARAQQRKSLQNALFSLTAIISYRNAM